METEISQEELQRKEAARKKIAKLVYKFKEEIVDSGRIKNYNEENVKMHYITPLFKALGWKMNDHNEVLYEENIYGKRADYLFILNGKKSLIVEAKQSNKSLQLGTTSGTSVAKQVISYAWHKQIPIAVATDFEELFVYHALTKPLNPAKNLMLIENKDFSLKFTDFIDKFELLWLLSRDSFENSRLDKYLKKDAKKHKTVDKSILEDLVHIRNWLTKDVKKYNQDLPKDEIDEVVQKLIDRLIFIRSVEDRGLENRKDWLLSIINDAKEQRLRKTIIEELKEVFKHFDRVYNSKLFAKSRLDEDIRISNDILGKVIFGLYFGTASGRFRYEFDQISVDLLGSIYEQYLGMLLRSTEKRVKLEEGKSKRKKMGIYYTPQYIVDYIVKNTVGEYMKGKSLKEIEDIKILDPACGSGSFLQRAYDEVREEVKRRIEKGEDNGIFDELETVDGEKKLFLGQKQQVLLRNIHGVDLDEQAVEIAQLSLLLKLLEGESSSTKKKRLPMLRNNIQCGNSLIDDYEVAGDKAFKWESRFKDIMSEGGFDIIIGNPPYVRMNRIPANLRKYYKNNFDTAPQRFDLFSIFLEKSINLLKNKGKLGLILPDNLLTNDHFDILRKFILDTCVIEKVFRIGSGAFKDATVSTVVIILRKEEKESLKLKNKIEFIKDKISTNIEQNNILNNELYRMIETIPLSFKDIVDLNEVFNISSGIQIWQNKKDADKHKNYLLGNKKDDTYKKALIGKDISKYSLKFSNNFVLYDKKKLERSREENIFLQNEKIVMKYIGNKLIATLDNEKHYALKSVVMLYTKSNEFSIKYLLTLINSKLLQYIYDSKLGEHYPRVNLSYVKSLPIRKISPEQQKSFIKLADRMLDLNKQLQQEKSDSKRERLQQQIKDTDYEIDQMVYKLYNLTPKEIKIVEESLK